MRNRSPFVGDKPLDSISLCFYGDSTGIKEWNRSSDHMPIKTMNNNGLQVLEEVPGEYKIYIDKDAVMTTVAKYAPGSYQTFMERKADIDNSRSLLRGYNIEWTQKDDSDLFIQCNDEAISKIENQPMTLDEPTQPIVLEPKTVPTTYDCCFRVGNDGIYIGEGYENLGAKFVKGFGCRVTQKEEGFFDIEAYDSNNGFTTINGTNIVVGTTLTTSWEAFGDFYRTRYTLEGFGENFYSEEKNGHITKKTVAKNADIIYLYGLNAQSRYSVRRLQITKTSTTKPWVKTIQPTCKLDRISNANETTHTFLNKGDGVVTFGNGYFSLKGEKIQQLLVYKALLTEQEKQAELAKDIKLR